MTKAVYGEVAEIRELRSLAVCRISIEVPEESYKAVVALLHNQKVLVTPMDPAFMVQPYGVVSTDPMEQEPVPPPEPEREAIGPLCQWAVMRCKDALFVRWLAHRYPEHAQTAMGDCGIDEVDGEDVAKQIICIACGISSRKQLDTDGHAKRFFNDAIRRPYSEHLTTL